MEIGVDSFVASIPDPATGRQPGNASRMAALLDEIEMADRVGLDTFGVGEHHRLEFLDASPAVILGAAAARTANIRLTSAVTVLSAADPVRVYQDFATIDLISGGRAELVVGRGSFKEAFPLFGYSTGDYDALFEEKLDLLLQIRRGTPVTWRGRFRPPLVDQIVYPRSQQRPLPVWIGVGGTPASVVRAARLGLPLMIGIIAGRFESFRGLVELYRATGHEAGHSDEQLRVGIHAFGFLADTDAAAVDGLFPGWQRMFTDAARERGWSPPTRAQFDAQTAPGGAFLVGTPDVVADRIIALNDTFGGVDRLTFQMSVAMLDPEAMLRSIELLGTQVAPRVRHALTPAGIVSN